MMDIRIIMDMKVHGDCAYDGFKDDDGYEDGGDDDENAGPDLAWR